MKREAKKDLVFYDYMQWKTHIQYETLYNCWFLDKIFKTGTNIITKDNFVHLMTESKLDWMFSGYTVRSRYKAISI